MMDDRNVILIISPKNFCDEEYNVTRSILESSGINCEVASTNLSHAIGMEGTIVKPDIQLKNVDDRNYDGLCFIGGVGCTVYWHDREVHKLISDTFAKGLLLCAICLAPVILANAGMLTGKPATAYPSTENYLKKKGVLYSGKAVETDNNIITAKNPEAAERFASKICDFIVQTTAKL